MFTRPVWAEISRSNLLANYRLLREAARDVQGAVPIDLLAVVKANAYGHGILECAPLLLAAGAEWIGVTCVEEGVRVRAVCPTARVLAMSGVWQGEAEALLQHRLTPVVWEQYHLDEIEAAAARIGLPPGSVPVHVEIDTGMSRQGVRVMQTAPPAPELDGIVQRFHAGSPLRLEAVMTHFTGPEEVDNPATIAQIARFRMATASFAAANPHSHPYWISAGNSATLLGHRDAFRVQQLSEATGARMLARPGLALYGYSPRLRPAESSPVDTAIEQTGDKLRPVLAWKTRITSLRNIDAGDGVGYDSTFRAARPTRLALLPLGYADGVSRLLSNRGHVLVRGNHAPVAGRVSMDQTIVDVTDVPGVVIGDEVALIGTQGNATITAYDIADITGTIPYEVLCSINARVPRILG